MPESKNSPRDFRQEVTDRIVRLLEDGVAPWQKPWNAGGISLLPVNPTTGKPYHGGNRLQLLVTALDRGYNDPRWMTYKQAADQEWQVRRGEKGTPIEFWDVKRASGKTEPGAPDAPAPPQEEGGEGDKPAKGRFLIHRIYTVFNAQQIDGIPALAPKRQTPFMVIEAGEKMLAHSGAVILHDQIDQAYYNRKADKIHLPRREFFKDTAGYYGTALHELAHWTGHPSRLDRATLNEAYKFGDTNHAKEELRAELASVFLAAERGIPHNPRRHAAYVANWIKALQDDKNEIFRAAHDASVAADYVLALEQGRYVAGDAADPPEGHTARLQGTLPGGVTR